MMRLLMRSKRDILEANQSGVQGATFLCSE